MFVTDNIKAPLDNCYKLSDGEKKEAAWKEKKSYNF